MNNIELVFENPPPGGVGRPRVWDNRAKTLRQHPGRWVNATKTWGVKSLQKERLTALGIQMQMRKVDGATNIFVRWIEGEKEGEE